jgi:hypothetical protein
MIIIDGTSYNIPILKMDESCDFLDKYAQRTIDGILHRELIGCYFNQSITFGTPTNTSLMQTLWNKLTEAEPYHTVTVPDADGVDFTFTAYFANVKRSLRRVTGSKTYWKTMTVNFIAQSPAKKA